MGATAGAPMCRFPARALMGSNRRGADEQVASRGPMGSNSRSIDEVLLTGAPWRRAIGKQLRARVAPAGKKSTCRQRKHCGQGKTLPAEVPIRYSAAKRADEMEFIVRSQREP